MRSSAQLLTADEGATGSAQVEDGAAAERAVSKAPALQYLSDQHLVRFVPMDGILSCGFGCSETKRPARSRMPAGQNSPGHFSRDHLSIVSLTGKTL